MKKLPYFIILLALNLNAYADDVSEEVYELSDFVVTDENDKGYFSGSSTSATKANELIKNTPVNVTVLNEELLDDLGINTTEDLAIVASSIDTDPTSYSLDQIRIRGFRNTFTRFNGYRRTLARDGYNIGRYDIIKGANSMIFGQASPGGTVNAIPLLANFRKDAGSVLYSFGNKDFLKKAFNYNRVFNDKLAARLMLVDHYQGYDHLYKNYDLKSRTLALNYRPDYTSSLQLHIEKVDSSFSFPSLSLKDDTRIDDSIDYGSTEDRSTYDGYISSSENRSMEKDFNVPFNSEWLNFVDDRMLFNLLWHTRNNGNPTALSNSSFFNDANNGKYPSEFAVGVPAPEEASGGDFLASEEYNQLNDLSSLSYNNFDENAIAVLANEVREYLTKHYSIINDLNYGYQSGPDKNKRVSGVFNTLDFQKVLGSGLELSISANYQEQDGKNIARDSYGISRVKDYYSNPSFIWPKPTQHVFFNEIPLSLYSDTELEDYYNTTQIPNTENPGEFWTIPDGLKEINYYTTGTPQTDYERALDALQPEPYIRTYWTKTEGNTKRKGLKNTLLYEKINDLPLLGKIENKFLLGWDIIDVNKSELRYDQIPDFGGDNSVVTDPLNPLNPDGSYLNPNISNLSERSLWLRESQITDRERAFEYIRLNNGFSSDRSILRLNDLIESDFIFENEDGGLTGITTGLYREDPDVSKNNDQGNYSQNRELFENEGGQRALTAKWQESTRLTADVNTNSQWLATQSSLYDGRLRTLVGFRFDKINVETTLRKTSLFGDGSSELFVLDSNDKKIPLTLDQINQKQSEKYTKVSPSLGALYWVNKNIGVFANFAQSIQSPTGQERTPVGTLPDPEIGEGLEFGIRFSTPDNSLDAQLAFYSIKKENDNEFKYSNLQLLQIYPYEELIYNENTDTIGSNPELIYIYNTSGSKPRLNKSTLPGRRADGDVTLSRGIELDINYNPTRNINFIASVNHNMKNKMLKIHPKVQDWMDQNGYKLNEQIDIFGRPDYRGSITGKYCFRSGKLKGLSFGMSQHYRSGSNMGRYYFYFDNNNNMLNSNQIKAQVGNPNTFDGVDTNNNGILDTGEPRDSDIIDRNKTQKYFIKSKPEHNTLAFINYNNFFRNGGKRYNYSINFRVNNLFNKKQFINRSNYGFYRESRSYNITTKVMF